MKIDREQWSRLSALLDVALDIEPSERDAWLERLPNDTSMLKEPLRTLLAQRANVETGDFLKTPDFASALRLETARSQMPAIELQQGVEVGAYRLLRELGRGGMGAVWLGERIDGKLKRQVALKFPYAGPNQRQLAERLTLERDILASLEHPNIARLYDADVTDLGQPFLVLEYVDGIPINEYCDRQRLNIRERLVLFLQVLNAVQYAHTHLVIHRDLKPSNILINNDRVARLLDFGIAKLVTEGVAMDSQLTEFGGRALTPDYASPEQISGQSITTASDVYALGVVLYELLTGNRPYRLKHDRRASLEDAIIEADIVAPSRAVLSSEAASLRSLSARQMLVALRGDVDAIVCKALRKSLLERYPSVDTFSQDIKRALDGEIITAQPPSPWYRARKFVFRNKVAVGAAGAIGVALLVGAGVALWQARLARAEAHRAETVQDFLISIFQVNTRDQVDPAGARGTTARDLLIAADLRLQQEDKLPIESRKQLMEVIAHLYNQMDLHKPAAELHARRVELLRKEGRASEEALVRALTEEATNYHSAGEFERGLALLREAEQILIRRKELDSWLAGYVYSCLSLALDRNDGAAAAGYAKRAMEIFRRTDPNSEALLGALLMVASVERSRDLTAAETASREALDVVRNLHGDRHALFGSSALYLADIQSDMLKFAEAERNYQLAAQVDDLTNDPNSDLRTQLDLRYGLFLVDQGRVNEGQPRLERVLANSIAVHGAQDRAYTAWAHENLARVWIRRGDLTRARTEIDAAVEIYRQGRPDAILAKSLEAQFDVLLRQGKPLEAAAVLANAIAAREASATLSEPGFREGILLRQAEIALAKRDYSQATALFSKVAQAAMPSSLRFRRYHYEALLGNSAVDLALDQIDHAEKGAQSLSKELKRQGDPPAFAIQAARAAMLAGEAQAANGQCDLAKRSLARSAEILSADQDAQSFRLVELARVRTTKITMRCP